MTTRYWTDRWGGQHIDFGDGEISAVVAWKNDGTAHATNGACAQVFRRSTGRRILWLSGHRSMLDMTAHLFRAVQDYAERNGLA